MALTAAQIQAAINDLAVEVALLHQIVQGNNATDVATESGVVPSLSKFYVQVLAAIAAQSFPGVLFSTPIATGSTYNVLTGDSGKTVVVTPSAYAAVNLGDPSTYPSPFVIEIVNAAVAGGHRVDVVPTGGARKRLYPGQGTIVKKLGGIWVYIVDTPRPREFMTFYVDAVLGNDNMTINDGLAPGTGAFSTIFGAYEEVRNNTAGSVGITLALGQTHGPLPSELIGDTYGQAYRQCTITGDMTYANQPVIQCNGNGQGCVHIRDNALVTLNGLRFSAGGHTGCIGVLIDGASSSDLASTTYDAFPGGVHLAINETCLVNLNIGGASSNTERITGGAVAHWRCDGLSKLQISGNVDLTNSVPDFSAGAFAISVGHGLTELSYGAPTTFVNAAGGVGGILGPKAILAEHAIFEQRGTALPGSAAIIDSTSNLY